MLCYVVLTGRHVCTAKGGRRSWGDRQRSPAPHPPADRCLSGYPRCTCSAPGTRRTRTACSWIPCPRPAPTGTSFRTSAMGKGVRGFAGMGCSIPWWPSCPQGSQSLVPHSVTQGLARSITRTQAFCNWGALSRGRHLPSPRSPPPPSGTGQRCHLVAAPGTAPGAADQGRTVNRLSEPLGTSLRAAPPHAAWTSTSLQNEHKNSAHFLERCPAPLAMAPGRHLGRRKSRVCALFPISAERSRSAPGPRQSFPTRQIWEPVKFPGQPLASGRQ